MPAKSLPDLLRRSATQWGGKAAMRVHGHSGPEEITYVELLDRVRAFAGAISTLGLEKGERLAIQSENCLEWMLAFWACQSLGIVVVPVYPSLPTDQSRYIVQDSGARVVAAGSEEQAAKTEGLEGVRTVLLRGAEGSLATLAATNGGGLEPAAWSKTIDSIEPEEIATIIYTSGTTGNPKGAELPHRAFTTLCESILASWPVDHRDTFLSYLPMSHVYECAAGQVLPMSCGATIAYNQSLRTLASDMALFRPTVMFFVPRILEAHRDKILDEVAKMPAHRRAMFGWTLAQGSRKLKGKWAPLAGLLDRLVAKKVRDRLGGRIRFVVSGGAALPPPLAEFFMSLGICILQGYGLTETTAITTVNHPDRNRPETIGEPIPCVEVSVAADGELLVRGPSVMLGYHNLPEATAEAIDADGWFHTGDLGAWDGKYLKITDRKKDLIILGNGKNVAPQPIEDKLRVSRYIADAVLLGDGKESVSALIVPNFDALRKAMVEAGGKPLPDADMVQVEAARSLIKSEIAEINKNLADFEKVKKHAVLDHPFSITGGELTPSLKVRRKVVKEKYRDLIAWLEG